jgi:hypothetical protein
MEPAFKPEASSATPASVSKAGDCQTTRLVRRTSTSVLRADRIARSIPKLCVSTLLGHLCVVLALLATPATVTLAKTLTSAKSITEAAVFCQRSNASTQK